MASDVAQYGQYNWDHVQHETAKRPHGQLPTYLQGVMQFMGDEERYRAKMATTPTERISLNNDWTVAFNGNHRVLALRILGPRRVKKSGMDRWVTIGKTI